MSNTDRSLMNKELDESYCSLPYDSYTNKTNLQDNNTSQKCHTSDDSSFRSLSAFDVLLSQITEKQTSGVDHPPPLPPSSVVPPSSSSHHYLPIERADQKFKTPLIGSALEKTQTENKTGSEETLEEFLQRLILRNSASHSSLLFSPRYSRTANGANYSCRGVGETMASSTATGSSAAKRSNDEATVILKNLLRIPTTNTTRLSGSSTITKPFPQMNTCQNQFSGYRPEAGLASEQFHLPEEHSLGYSLGTFGKIPLESEPLPPRFNAFPCYPNFALPGPEPDRSLDSSHMSHLQLSFSNPKSQYFPDVNGGLVPPEDNYVATERGFSPFGALSETFGRHPTVGNFHRPNFSSSSAPQRSSLTRFSSHDTPGAFSTDAKHTLMGYQNPAYLQEPLSLNSLGLDVSGRESLIDALKPPHFNRKQILLSDKPPTHNKLYLDGRSRHSGPDGFSRFRSIRPSLPHNNTLERQPTSLYKLSLCLPITIPYGTIHVTKASGENFYSFTNVMLCTDEAVRRNASMLFSPELGICDAWASFLHIRAGYIFNVRAKDIEQMVKLFHTVMTSAPPNQDLFKTPLKLTCRGLYTCSTNITPSGDVEAGNRKFETRGFFQEELGPRQFLYLCERIRCLSEALNCVFNASLPIKNFSSTVSECIQQFRDALQDSREHIVPAVHINSFFQIKTLDDLENFPGLPITVREYGQVQNKELEDRFLKDDVFVMEHQVPNVQISELRLEHQSKKMVDPRFRHNFVLTRQMAGDENPNQWNHSRFKPPQTTPTQTLEHYQPHNQEEEKSKNETLRDENQTAENPRNYETVQHTDGVTKDVPGVSKEKTLESSEDKICEGNKSAEENLATRDEHTQPTSSGPREVSSLSPSSCGDMKQNNLVTSIGRYQFCCNADVPLVDIAYRDAKDCLSSTHGFIYMRHLMSQKQQSH